MPQTYRVGTSTDTSPGKAPALATLEGGGRRVEVLTLERNTPNTVLARYRMRTTGLERIDPALNDIDHGPFYQDWPSSFSVIYLLDGEPDAATIAQAKGLVEGW
jgi:hypothetical protein